MSDNPLHPLIGKFYLQYPDGSFVATDQDSGGYPRKTTDAFEISLWASWEEVQRYRNRFHSEGLTINKIQGIHIEKMG